MAAALTDLSLVLEQLKKDGKASDFIEFQDGTILWTASLILLNYLQRDDIKATLKGRRVLELGSGLGHLGVGIHRLGAHVTCTERDQELQPLLASVDKQLAEQVPSGQEGSITAMALEWGEEGFNKSPLTADQRQPYDIIIASELYYKEELFPHLLWTMKQLSRPGTIIYSIFLDRPFTFMFFALMSDEGCWDIQQISGFDDLGLDPEVQPHMHHMIRL